MKTLYQGEYALKNINHPRYGNIEILTIGEQIWFNLNDLCQSAKTTASSAINSLDEGTPHLVYIQHPGKEDYSPFVTEQGFLLAETERTQAYKKHILNWAYNELQEPILPTFNQMVVLSPEPNPNAHENLVKHQPIEPQNPTRETLDEMFIKLLNQILDGEITENTTDNRRWTDSLVEQLQPQKRQSQDREKHIQKRRSRRRNSYDPKPHSKHNVITSQYQACEEPCNIHRYTLLLRKEGFNLSPYQFLLWLIRHGYICRKKEIRFRPRNVYYNKGYFVDNRNTFNPFYPQRDLLITTDGQRYFYEKLSAEK